MSTRNINAMQIGEQIVLEGDEVLDVKYLRTLETKPKKNVDRNGNAVVPVPYAQMRYGSTSFTVNTDEDVEILTDKAKRDDIYSMTLEVSEFDEEDIDGEGNPVMDNAGNPVMKHRRGLAFVSLMTFESKIKRAQRAVAIEGAVYAEKVKYGLPTATDTEAVAALLAQKMGIGATANVAEPIAA